MSRRNMPRKVSGRARPATPASRLLLDLDRVNRKLEILSKSKNFYTYSSKKLINTIRRDSAITYKRTVRSKIPKISVNVNKLNTSQIRYYEKVFRSFLQSKTSYPLGIQEVRKKSEESLKESLGQITDKEITQQDVDDFYDMLYDSDFKYLAEKIGPSEVYILIENARNGNLSKKDFITTLSQYMTVNNADVRKKASRIYDKFIGS